MINTIQAKRGSPTIEEIQEEDDFRKLARTKYRYFRRYIDAKFKEGPHNLLLAKELEQVELYLCTRGKEGNGRLIVEMPPQHGKTTDIARKFPSWVIGRNPWVHVGIVSYGADLADKHSAAIRDIVLSNEFRNLFGSYSMAADPVMLSDDSASKSDWSLALPHEGSCLSRGIGGGLSGNPLDLLIIDDPTKDIEDGRSEIHQKKLENWFDSVAMARLSEYGVCIIDHTRWDPNDLIGQILKRMASNDPNIDQWKVIHLPALALEEDEYPQTDEDYWNNLSNGVFIPKGGDQLGRKPGQALFTYRYSQGHIEKTKATIEAKSPYTFASVYQQLPRPFSGGMFDAKDIREEDAKILNPDWTWVCYIDVALGKNKRSDFNAGCIETISPESGDVIVRDMLRVRELDKFLKLLKLWMLKDENKKVLWGIEDVAFQSLAFQNFWTDPTLATVAMMKFPVPEGSKQDRAMNLSLRAKEGHLVIIKNPVWNQPFKNQLMAFPFDSHDDIVDSASGGLYILAKYSKPKREARSYQG